MKKIFTTLCILFSIGVANSLAVHYVYQDTDEHEYSAPGGNSWTTNEFSGPAAQITFDAAKSGLWAVGDIVVTQLVNDEWKPVTTVMPSGDYKKYESFGPFELDRNAKQVRFYSNGSYKRYIKNIYVTMASYVDSFEADAWEAPTAVVGAPDEAASTTVAWSNTTAFELSLEGDASQFTYAIENNASEGAFGVATISATYKHTVAGTHNAILNITTAFGTHQISLTGSTLLGEQTITWEQELIDLKVDDVITLEATAATDITYESSDSNVAQVVGNQLYLLRLGTAVITANAIESNEYMSATLSREIVVDKADVLINVLPIASPITYGQSLAESLLSNGETSVEGVFEWLDPTIQPIPGEWIYVVTFTPVETDKYNSIDIEVSVLVNKVAQEILWDLTETSLEVGDTLYLDAIATSGLSIVYSVDNNEIARLEDNMLIALAEGAVSLTAAQDGDEENYVAAAEPIVYLITINAKLPTSLQTTQLGGAKAYKTIRNGQLVIISGEHTYDALGNLIR